MRQPNRSVNAAPLSTLAVACAAAAVAAKVHPSIAVKTLLRA
jgi:hypothetical protein